MSVFSRNWCPFFARLCTLHAQTAETANETQSLSDVVSIGNTADRQIKNVTDPVDAQDAATKSYADAITQTLTQKIETFQEEVYLLTAGFRDPRDGNHYDVVKIGDQYWMAENLRYLPEVVGPGTGSETTAYYYVYGYDGTSVTDAKATANYTTYGVLYNWAAAMNGAASSNTNPSGVQGVCPTGWHLPSNEEWAALADTVGGSSIAGGVLKEAGTAHWTTPNTDATNKVGFTALPGGYRSSTEGFEFVDYVGYWWTTTASNTNDAFYRSMGYGFEYLRESEQMKEYGSSVRCVKD